MKQTSITSIADKRLGKSKFIVYSSSSDTKFDDMHDNINSSEIKVEDIKHCTNILLYPVMYKPIKKLQLHPDFKGKDRKFIVDYLMSNPMKMLGKTL